MSPRYDKSPRKDYMNKECKMWYSAPDSYWGVELNLGFRRI